MTLAPRTTAACVVALLANACSRTPPAAPVTATAAAAVATPQAALPAAKNDGAPHIVNSAAGAVHIQYRLYGAGKPLVVLVHGWSCDSNYWAAQIKPLAEHYTVMTVDLAGHGASGANRKDFSMRSFGADVASAVQALPDARKVIIVGHSMGGPVAIEAAAQLGDRVLAVIGVDTFRAVGDKPRSAAESAKQLAPFEKDFIGSTRALVAAAFFRKDADPMFVRRIADDMSQAPAEVAIPAVRELAAWRGEGPMRALNLPVVAINSDLHGITDEARIRKRVPKFSVVTIADTGHFLMMEHPEKFNPVLLQQLAKLSTP